MVAPPAPGYPGPERRRGCTDVMDASPGRTRDHRIAEEQAALRRVAVLVAGGAPPRELFGAVTEEVGRLLEVDFATLVRYDPQDAITIVGTWTRTGAPSPTPVGDRMPLGGRNLSTLVYQTGRPERIDYDVVSGAIGDAAAREWRLRLSAGVPIRIEGQLWGAMLVAFTREESLPADAEARLAGFTELVATAVANAQARTELRGFAEEQAALRRVATLVAGGASPEEVFTAVAGEVGRLLGTVQTNMLRYDPDDVATIVAVHGRVGDAAAVSVGDRYELGGRNATTLVFQTGRPARIDGYSGAWGAVGRAAGYRSSVGVPISVEGRLWGVIGVASTRDEPLPADIEVRLAGFTELVATAVANAQARVELRGFAEEQAALRRVATLVAGGAPPEEVFTAVPEEVGHLLKVDYTVVSRYDADGLVTVVGGWASTDPGRPLGIGLRLKPEGRNIHALVFQTGQPTRIDDYGTASGAFADVARDWQYRSSVGVPISVEGRLWGVMIAGSREESLSADTEARLVGFTEMVATAIADAQARVELRGFAEEQAALRRVATLVARAAPPEEVFGAVAEEAGRLLGADSTVMSRYDPDGAAIVVGVWDGTGAARVIPVGLRLGFGGANVHTLVFQTGRPGRIDDYSAASGDAADAARRWGFRSAVGVPISVEDRLWGVMSVASAREEPPSADTEERLAAFTELIVTALVNAEAQAALNASRARIVAAADRARRRIERNLHDGAQQRLVSLALHLREAQAAAPEADELADRLEGAVTEVTEVLEELREIARGIHPAILTEGGLPSALRALARRCAVPVSLDIKVAERLPEPVEIAAYYAISEALTNTAKHAHASAAEVEVAARDGGLRVCVRDDGRGGADFAGGSGLAGIKDRMEALGGRIWLHSPPGAGTAVHIVMPLGGPGGPGPSAGAANSPR
ncbi:MAG TPA: GAF domain-containing protein [Streptosporangiaceae bacterium]|nr:GAF domain-containing protein [Streptosporangiaceae bacterium]